MNEMLVAEKVAWRRENARHHYVGALFGSADALRLAGRDPATGIEVVLVIPLHEVEGVRLSELWDERVAGERAAILDLADSVPILIREIGTGALEADDLAARISALVDAGPRVAARRP